MRLTRSLGFAGALILSAIVGGTLIGNALATDDTNGTDATGGVTAYCDVFMDTLASELGTDRDGLVAAGRTAAIAALDAAVEAGDIDDDRAAEIRERIEAADGDGCGWFGHGLGFARGFAHGSARGFLGADVLDAAADALGVDSSDLIAEVRDAGSLQAAVDARGGSYDDVKAAVLSSVEADLDAAVADDGLSQERADAALDRISTWLDDGGPVPDGPRFGPWGQRHHDFDRDDADDDAEGDDQGA